MVESYSLDGSVSGSLRLIRLIFNWFSMKTCEEQCTLPLSLIAVVLTLLCDFSLVACSPKGGSGNNGSAPSSPQTVADLYVSPQGNDSSSGSSASPWKTLQHAADSVSPGATVHVAPGDYLGPVESRISGTANARISFVSDTRWAARIHSFGAESAWTNRGSYVDIQGFDLTGDGRIGIMNLGSSVQLVGNYVHDIPAPGCTDNGGAGIVNANDKSSGNDIVGNVVHDIGNISTPCNRVHGIYASGSGGHVWNNIAYRNQGFGIHLYHKASGIVVSNNLVFANGTGGLLVGADGGGPPAERMLVTNNIVMHNSGVGIWEFGAIGRLNRYLNNIVFANGTPFQLQSRNATSGTISSDPKLRNFRPDGSGDYRPSADSPALHSGTSEGSPPFDINGVKRPSGSCDIGPFQVSNTPQLSMRR